MDVNASGSIESSEAPRFQIFRCADAPHHKAVDSSGMTEIVAEGFRKLQEAGGIDTGYDIRLLIDIPGFNLTYNWFKSDFPLPRHSHKGACCYYIVGGSLTIGTDVLGKGDSFFVPGNSPYAYTVGPEGVEVLEFRTEGVPDIKYMANNPAFWAKAVASCPENRARWATEPRPSATPKEASGRGASVDDA